MRFIHVFFQFWFQENLISNRMIAISSECSTEHGWAYFEGPANDHMSEFALHKTLHVMR
jgi:hypothetical protein